MQWSGLTVVVAAFGITGCVYTSGEISYSQHPEMAQVILYSGHPEPLGVTVTRLSKTKRGFGNCSALATAALTEMLADAKALGATGVKDVKFRGKWNWMGRVVCRNSVAGQSVEIEGTAFKMPMP